VKDRVQPRFALELRQERLVIGEPEACQAREVAGLGGRQRLVDEPELVAERVEAPSEVGADEPGTAGDDDPQAISPN